MDAKCGGQRCDEWDIGLDLHTEASHQDTSYKGKSSDFTVETPGDSTLTKWKKLTVRSEWGVVTSFTSWFHALRNDDIFSVALLSKMPSFLILRKHQANPNWEIVYKISTVWRSRKHRDWGTVTGDHTALKCNEGFCIGSRTREKTPPLPDSPLVLLLMGAYLLSQVGLIDVTKPDMIYRLSVCVICSTLYRMFSNTNNQFSGHQLAVQ